MLCCRSRETCSVRDSQCHLTASEAEKLAALLPKFFRLNLALTSCFAAEVEKLVVSVNHVTLKGLLLNEISLTPSSASVLGQSLPEMSCLEKLILVGGSNGDVLPVKALFGGFHKTLPLSELRFMDFNIGGCIAPLSDSLRFFPQLRRLELHSITWNEHNLLHLFRNLEFIPRLETLSLTGTLQSDSEEEVRGCSEEEVMQASFTHQTLNRLCLSNVSLTLAVAKLLGQLIHEMSCLEKLVLVGGSNGDVLPVKALFGGFHKTLPLSELRFMDFNIGGCIAPLSDSLRFFPQLRRLELHSITWNEHNLLHLFRNLEFIPRLETLSLTGTLQSDSEEEVRGCSEEEVMQASFTHQTLNRLCLSNVSMTLAVAKLLGQLIPKMSALKELRIYGRDDRIFEGDDRILQDGKVEVLFGGFKERLPLQQLAFHKFSVKGRLDHLINSSQFPELQWAYVDIDINFIINDANFLVFLECLRNICSLHRISIHCKSVARADCKGEGNSGRLQVYSGRLFLLDASFTPTVARALGRLISEMSSLEEFTFSHSNCSNSENDENTLEGEESSRSIGSVSSKNVFPSNIGAYRCGWKCVASRPNGYSVWRFQRGIAFVPAYCPAFQHERLSCPTLRLFALLS